MTKFEKDFRKYLKKQRLGITHEVGERQPNIVDLAKEFDKLPDSMKWGVYVDFFDSAGIRIDIDVDAPERYEQGDWFDYYIYTKTSTYENERPFTTRPEARKAALEKAIEIYNTNKPK